MLGGSQEIKRYSDRCATSTHPVMVDKRHKIIIKYENVRGPESRVMEPQESPSLQWLDDFPRAKLSLGQPPALIGHSVRDIRDGYFQSTMAMCHYMKAVCLREHTDLLLLDNMAFLLNPLLSPK